MKKASAALAFTAVGLPGSRGRRERINNLKN